MKKPILYGLTALLFGPTTLSLAQTPESAVQQEIATAKQVITEYVKARREIARIKNEWNSYQELAERRINLYESEVQKLREQITAAEEDTTQAERTIAEVRQEIAKLRAANDVVARAMPDIELTLRELYQYFPKPLKTKLERFFSELGKSRQASERMAVVIAILNEVDKFNAEYTLAEEDKKMPSGETKIVDVLYLGLAVAYFADKEGTMGGILSPAKGEWISEERTELAPAIREAISYYNGDIKPAVLVNLPLEVKDIQLGL